MVGAVAYFLDLRVDCGSGEKLPGGGVVNVGSRRVDRDEDEEGDEHELEIVCGLHFFFFFFWLFLVCCLGLVRGRRRDEGLVRLMGGIYRERGLSLGR